MILILSDSFDYSTTKVIEWLDYFKKKWICIKKEDSLELEFLGNEIILKFNSKFIKLSEINSFWYRRGTFTINQLTTNIEQFDKLKSEEINRFAQFIFYKLNKLKHINSITNSNVNKLIINDIARELNIITPDDLIFSNVNDLKKTIVNSNKSYITKVVSGHCIQVFEEFTIYNYTNLIGIDKIYSEKIFPSYVQNYISKKYELRIFYLNGVFYSMAIFSQKDSLTKIDFRNYNDKEPNRTVPFKLPIEIEISLDLLMKKLDLNCGSIDMIVTPKNEYVFLEVNPIGQFGMVSYPCNYNLEKKIAEYL